MRVVMLLLVASALCFATPAGFTQEPQQISDDGVAPAVWGVIETPSTPGPHPGVILLPGSAGWRPEYARIAATFADSGFVALAIDYYAETGSDTSRADRLAKWPAWQATVRNAVTCLRASPSVSGVALVGYSRGAFLAVSVASSVPGVSAVVDFFGGGATAGRTLDEEVQHFPPLLILHGDADSAVPIRFAYELQEAVTRQGGEVEMHVYSGAGHAFNAPWNPAYSDSLTADSWRRVVGFLRRRLGH